MNGRRQSVVIDGEHAQHRLITLGKFQESVLGPLLFTIFLNDLPRAVSLSTVDIYAVDTCNMLGASAAVSNLPVVFQQRLQEDIILYRIKMEEFLAK